MINMSEKMQHLRLHQSPIHNKKPTENYAQRNISEDILCVCVSIQIEAINISM